MNDLKDKSPRILVIGDLIVDKYLWGSCDRISPEAPVQVIKVDNETVSLGGAGNVVNNLKKLGAEVDIISVIGNCDVSVELRSLLSSINVNTEFLVTQTNRISSKKSRIIASQQQVVRYDKETSDDINAESQDAIVGIFKEIVENYEAILISDYGKGVLTKNLTVDLIKIANKNKKIVLVDPKGEDYSKYKGAYLLTPNKKEAGEATKIHIHDDNSLKAAIMKLKSICSLDKSIITLSENGIAIYDDELRIHPTTAQEVFDVTGAGDTVLASLGFSLACGYRVDEAVQFANLAGGVVVGKIGSATVTLTEIIEFESRINKSSSEKHIKTKTEIANISKELKAKGKKIVFTNGCFDLLHAGHINYLEAAKKFGDVLILGLNSDQSVSLLKGKNRPINVEQDRAYILAAIEVVDYVVIFDEKTPYELIKIINPHILVKGNDYKEKDVVGQDLVEELKLVEFIDGKSSTNTIERIKSI